MKFPRIPPLPFKALEKYLEDFSAVVSSELTKRTPDATVRQSVLLHSTDGNTVWEITVNDLGTITATKVFG